MKRKNLEVMATFSHPIRVEIMRLLSGRKMTVNELADELPLTSGGVRPHLSYFINRKLLHSKRSGRTVHYWLHRERLAEALSEFGAGAGIDVNLVAPWSVEEPRGEPSSERPAKRRASKKRPAKKRSSKKRPAKKRSSKKRPAKKRSAKGRKGVGKKAKTRSARRKKTSRR